jgi:hypothetical protein
VAQIVARQEAVQFGNLSRISWRLSRQRSSTVR